MLVSSCCELMSAGYDSFALVFPVLWLLNIQGWGPMVSPSGQSYLFSAEIGIVAQN